MKSKYLKVVELIQFSKKTKVWRVQNNSNEVLGKIGWYPKWRGYVFIPFPDIIFDKVCLRDIADFIEHQNKLHYDNLRSNK